MGVCEGVKDRLDIISLSVTAEFAQLFLEFKKILSSLGATFLLIEFEDTDSKLLDSLIKFNKFFEGATCSRLRTFLSDDKKLKLLDFKSWNLYDLLRLFKSAAGESTPLAVSRSALVFIKLLG
jgi:hypothetical protein